MVATACAHTEPSKWWSQPLTTLPGCIGIALIIILQALVQLQSRAWGPAHAWELPGPCIYFLNSTRQQLRNRQKTSRASSLPLLPCRAEKTKNLQGFLGTSREESDHKNKFLQQKAPKTSSNTSWDRVCPRRTMCWWFYERTCVNMAEVTIQPMIRKKYATIWKAALALLCS